VDDRNRVELVGRRQLVEVAVGAQVDDRGSLFHVETHLAVAADALVLVVWRARDAAEAETVAVVVLAITHRKASFRRQKGSESSR
jgi:hypothetical protein